MPKTAPTLGTVLERARSQLALLIAQFVLGTAVNLLGEPTTGIAKTSQAILLVLHVLVAIGLIVGGILTIRAATDKPEIYQRLARGGGVNIGLAILAGVLNLALGSEWWSFLMAIAFLASFVCYGALYVRTRVTLAAK